MADGKLGQWLRTVIDKWTDIAALIGGLLSVILIAGVVITGLHERQLPLRSGGSIPGSHQTQP